jgi:hypothetical protein
MRILAYAMDYWSGGKIKAIFLEHEVNNQLEMSDTVIDIFLVYFPFSGIFQCCWLLEKIHSRC